MYPVKEGPTTERPEGAPPAQRPAKKKRAPRAAKPKKAPEPKKVFVEDTILPIWKETGPNYSEEIRVVVWVIDGKRTAPRLERREKTFDEANPKRIKRSKAKGLTLRDVEEIAAKIEVIIRAMREELDRPAAPPPAAAPEPIEESPFL